MSILGGIMCQNSQKEVSIVDTVPLQLCGVSL